MLYSFESWKLEINEQDKVGVSITKYKKAMRERLTEADKLMAYKEIATLSKSMVGIWCCYTQFVCSIMPRIYFLWFG